MKLLVQRPLLTEKTLALAAKGWYTFVVDKEARKKNIATEVAAYYKVNVTDVRTLSVHGKTRRVGRKMLRVAKPDWKKALVQLNKGQTIDAFEVTPQEEKEKKV